MNRLVWMVLWASLLIVNRDRMAKAGEGFEALVGRQGRVQLSRGRDKICDLGAGLYDSQWTSAQATADPQNAGTETTQRFRIAVPGAGTVSGEAKITADSKNLNAAYILTPDRDVALNSLHVAANFDVAALAGARWVADGQSGLFPKDFGATSLFNGSIRSLKLELPTGARLEFTFPKPTAVLLQDNRQWDPTFVIRIHRSSSQQQPFKKGIPVAIGFVLSAPGGVAVQHDRPVTIVADQDWIPLRLELDIAPDSALDFSAMGLQDAPAGKHGWLHANTDGTFSFERQPGKPVRFYGVNLCFSAHYITHDQSDQLAERLVRLGYNTVRLHHYESELTDRSPDRTQLNEEKLDQLDYLIAALIRRGIYVTTDLFVSRPVDIARLAPDFAGSRGNAMNGFKVLAALQPQAYENWKTFGAICSRTSIRTRSVLTPPSLPWPGCH